MKTKNKKLQITLLILLAAAAVFAVASLRRSLKTDVLAKGTFHSVSHKGSGTVEVVRKPDSRLSLRITNFRTYYRPDLTVLLISAPDALENETVRNSTKFLVGPLKSDEGSMEYSLPSDLKLDQFNAVTIWSERYQVNFTTAPLVKREGGSK